MTIEEAWAIAIKEFPDTTINSGLETQFSFLLKSSNSIVDTSTIRVDKNTKKAMKVYALSNKVSNEIARSSHTKVYSGTTLIMEN